MQHGREVEDFKNKILDRPGAGPEDQNQKVEVRQISVRSGDGQPANALLGADKSTFERQLSARNYRSKDGMLDVGHALKPARISEAALETSPEAYVGNKKAPRMTVTEVERQGELTVKIQVDK